MRGAGTLLANLDFSPLYSCGTSDSETGDGYETGHFAIDSRGLSGAGFRRPGSGGHARAGLMRDFGCNRFVQRRQHA
jgi:hypothetical protein